MPFAITVGYAAARHGCCLHITGDNVNIYFILPGIAAALGIPLFFKDNKPARAVYLLIVFGFMMVMCSMRYSIGYDYDHYRDILDKFADHNYGFADAFKVLGCEPFYTVLMKISVLFPYSMRYLALNTMTAALCYLPVSYVIFRYSRYPQLSAFLYICITFFYNTMNFTRQSMAASLVFLAFNAIRERRHWLVILLAVLGGMFHLSALVIIPVYLVSLIKPSWQFYTVIGVLAGVVFIFSDKLINFAVTTFVPRYQVYLGTVFLRKGLGIPYLLIPLLIAVLHIVIYFTCGKEQKGFGTFTQFTFICFIIWLFSMKHMIVERFSLPIYLFIIMSVPEAAYCLHETKPKHHREVSLILATFFCAFVYDYFTISEGVHGIFPYRSITAPTRIDHERLDIRPRDCFVNSPLVSFLYTVSHNDYTIFVVNSGASNGKFPIEEAIGFHSLGLDSVQQGVESYICCITDNKPAVTRSDSMAVSYHTSLYNKYEIDLASDHAHGTASVVVNGVEFVGDEPGLYFVVFDDTKQMIVTSQGYDLSDSDRRYLHVDVFNTLEYCPGFEDYDSGLELGLLD